MLMRSLLLVPTTTQSARAPRPVPPVVLTTAVALKVSHFFFSFFD